MSETNSFEINEIIIIISWGKSLFELSEINNFE